MYTYYKNILPGGVLIAPIVGQQNLVVIKLKHDLLKNLSFYLFFTYHK